jgi:hypothetical protein
VSGLPTPCVGPSDSRREVWSVCQIKLVSMQPQPLPLSAVIWGLWRRGGITVLPLWNYGKPAGAETLKG